MEDFLTGFWAILGLWGIGISFAALRSLFSSHQEF